jgi:cytochrome c peroxidase
MKRVFILIVAIVVLSAFIVSRENLFIVPKGWPKPVYNFSKNPLTHEKVALGRILFYDPILSLDNSISCASCHAQYNAFTHVDHQLSHGIFDSIGTRNSPAIMNLAWQKLFMWDGAINHLDVQALGPISHPSEMAESISNVVKKINSDVKYRGIYFRAFGDSIATGERTLKAISQFMLTLVSSNSKYDSVMRHQQKFTNQEKSGLALFEVNCASCHPAPLFTTNEFENNGLKLDEYLNDFGRLRVTHKSEDSLKFKVPTLRNIEFSFPYMHDGRFKSLNEVVNHYTSGIQMSQTLSKKLKTAVKLSANEKVDLIAFLLTLTDKKFLFNPKFGYLKIK